MPTIHLGPRGQVIEQFVQRPASKKVRNALGREVDYVTIDQGRTRRERHAEIEDINLERAIRSPNFETRERAKWEKDQRKLDRDLERKLIDAERKLTIERRALRGRYRSRFDDLRSQQNEQQAAARTRVDAIHKPIASALRRAQASERLDLRIRSSSVWQRLLLAIDFTGQAKGRREAARHALSVRHQGQRQVVINNRKTALHRTEEAVASRFAPLRENLIRERDEATKGKRDRHMEVRKIADAARQDREAQRERGRRQLDSFIAVAKDHMAGRSGPAPGREFGR